MRLILLIYIAQLFEQRLRYMYGEENGGQVVDIHNMNFRFYSLCLLSSEASFETKTKRFNQFCSRGRIAALQYVIFTHSYLTHSNNLFMKNKNAPHSSLYI